MSGNERFWVLLSMYTIKEHEGTKFDSGDDSSHVRLSLMEEVSLTRHLENELHEEVQ